MYGGSINLPIAIEEIDEASVLVAGPAVPSFTKAGQLLKPARTSWAQQQHPR
jgi:hypothetical protein